MGLVEDKREYSKKCQLISAFIQCSLQDSILRYLRCIPFIVSMQTALKHRYGKKITKEEANSITIKECILQCKNGNVYTCRSIWINMQRRRSSNQVIITSNSI